MALTTHYHFAYADHLNEENARRICPGATFEGIAELIDYRLIFTPHGRASLQPESGAAVWGVVWCLSNRDIFNLGKNEEEHLPDYRRHTVEVKLADGRLLQAFCYTSLITGDAQPNPKLLRAMIDDAEFWGLPAHYIKSLRELLQSIS